MKKLSVCILTAGIAAFTVLSGCGSKNEEQLTPIAAPTATPAPRMIGVKDSKSKFVYLTNSLGTDIRELYLMASGTEEWGDNLIPSESSIKAAEQVQMFYTPETIQDSSEDDSPEDADYNLKLVTADGTVYELYGVELGDMEKATLSLDKATSEAYLRYMSISENKEKSTKGSSEDSDPYEESYDEDSDNDSYEDDSYSDSADDGSVDEGSDDDGSTDDGSADDDITDEIIDDGNTDDGSTDDGSIDNGSADDGTADDGEYDEEGLYDDGDDDEPGDEYVDAEDGDDYYDTEEY